MKDIFANLYNKVVSFFHQADEKTSNAKDVACNRLKLVLMQDRTNLTPAIMDRMRRELVELLSKYLELDRELLDLNFENEEDQMALMLSIPVIRAKSEDEIKEILEKEDEERRKIEELSKSDDEEAEDESEESDEAEESDDEEESKEDTEDSEDSEDSEESDEDQDDADDSDEDEDDEEADEEVKKEKFFSRKKGKKSTSEEE